MHPALANDDITRLICEFIAQPLYVEFKDETDEDKDKKVECQPPDISAETTLDFLWKEIRDLYLVLRLMPDDLWEVVRSTEASYEDFPFEKMLVPRRAIKAEDWLRVNHYAPRVKSLVYDFPDEDFQGLPTVYITQDAFDVLSSYSPFRPLLPNLKTLNYVLYHQYDDVVEPFMAERTLLSSTLENATYESFCPDISWEALTHLVNGLAGACPALKELGINNAASYEHDGAMSPLLQSSLSKHLPLWKDLQILSVECSYSHEAFDVVSRLPNLADLTLNMTSYVPRLESVSDDRFPRLKELVIYSSVWGGIPYILGLRCISSSLRSIEINNFHMEEDNWESFFDTLDSIAGNSDYQRLLEKLTIDSMDTPDYVTSDGNGRSGLDQLANLKNLRELWIEIQPTRMIGVIPEHWLHADYPKKCWRRLQKYTIVGLTHWEAETNLDLATGYASDD